MDFAKNVIYNKNKKRKRLLRMRNIKRFVYALERHLNNNFIKMLALALNYEPKQLENDIKELITFIDNQK